MDTRVKGSSLEILPREVTQAKLDRRSAAAMRHRASQPEGLAERFESIVSQHGPRPFVVYGGETFSYAQVDQHINQAAHALRGLGVQRGDVVALCMENRPAFLVVWFALAKLGAVAAFLNTNVSGRPLRHALTATAASRVIVGEECLGLFEALGPVANSEGAAHQDLARAVAQPSLPPLWLWPDAERPASAQSRALCALDLQALAQAAPTETPPAAWRAGLTAGDPAVYIFTSGTTGLPKAAVISHARWLITADVMHITMDIDAQDRFYCFLPLYHGAASLSATATAVAAGSSLVLRRKFSRREFWPEVRQHGITVCQYVGEICRFLLSQPAQDGDAVHPLRKMVGAGLAPEIWDQWVRRFGPMSIFEGWGSTEANTNTLNLDNRPGSCGRIPFWEKTNLRLVRFDADTGSHPRGADGWMQLAAVDEPGEAIGKIHAYPDIVAGRFEGYTSAQDTERKILRNVFEPGDAWWSSGDLLRCDADGYCWFVDRIGDTFRWKSENVSTTEVADVLGDFPGMLAITVYGVQVPGHEGRAGMAAVVMQRGVDFDPQAFHAFASSRLPRYAAPVFVRVSPEPDMTGNYKLRKVDLQREAFDVTRVSDPLFVRVESAGTYLPLTEARLQEALGA
jgi:fatty-acyl-CoA synthase